MSFGENTSPATPREIGLTDIPRKEPQTIVEGIVDTRSRVAELERVCDNLRTRIVQLENLIGKLP